MSDATATAERPCAKCSGRRWTWAVCYAVGVAPCPECGDPTARYIWSGTGGRTCVYRVPESHLTASVAQCLAEIRAGRWVPVETKPHD